jgi:hypothetical protein
LSTLPPLPESLGIPGDKIVRYLLNPDHPKGGSKAKFFLHFGFSTERNIEFADALFAQAMGAESFERYPTPFGREMLTCVGRIWTPSGRKPRISTVWLVKDEVSAVLVTAFPNRGSAV